jgi:8-oxo-dGTP pyrophosphatase MutT (NUDIX family)
MRTATDPRDSATVVVLRAQQGRAEALMLRRHGKSPFAADAWVFPGGTVDEADCRLHSVHWAGIDPEALAPRFEREPDLVLGLHVAAVRETFEEAGLLLARRADGVTVDLRDPAVRAMRLALADPGTEADFHAWVADTGLVLDLGALTYWSRWVTPIAEPRRYDTCFYLARAPRNQVAEHDRVETTGQRWIAPPDALAAAAAKEMTLVYPTLKNLETMAAHRTVDELVAVAAARSEVRKILPHVELDDHGNYIAIYHPDDPGFPHHLYEEAS